VPDSAAPPVTVVDILPHVTFGTRSVGDKIELKGSNFGADASKNRVLIGDAPATISSATTTSIKLELPLPNRARPGQQPVRVDNLTTKGFGTTSIWVW
jgi:hypothetical protein